MGMPIADKDIMEAVAEDVDPRLLEKAREEYPVLRNVDVDYKYSPQQDLEKYGKLEFFPSDEPGSPERPRPKEFPVGRPLVEVYDPKTRPIDILGDIASHYMIEQDPRVQGYYSQFQKSLLPGQYDRLRSQYQFAQKNFGEERPYEQWYERTGLPGYFRGYPFQQWPEDFNETAYTPEQRQLLDEMMQYFRTGE
jgi:hypothetical protein